MNTWAYDADLDTYLLGTQDSGCGVFLDGDHWEANVVHPLCIENLGSFPTREAAMQEAERVWGLSRQQVGA